MKKKFRLWKLPRAFWATELFTPWTIMIFLYLVSSGIHFNFLTCPVDCFTQHNLKIAWRNETHFSVHRYIGVYIHKCVYRHIYKHTVCTTQNENDQLLSILWLSFWLFTVRLQKKKKKETEFNWSVLSIGLVEHILLKHPAMLKFYTRHYVCSLCVLEGLYAPSYSSEWCKWISLIPQRGHDNRSVD